MDKLTPNYSFFCLLLRLTRQKIRCGMRITPWLFSLLGALFLQEAAVASPAVGYTLSGGRLGDNLLSYMHAKWISYKYGIPQGFFIRKSSDFG